MKTQLLVGLLGLGLLLSTGRTLAQEPPAAPAPKLSEAEQKFQKALSGATLVGAFTEGKAPAAPKEERYTIQNLTKISDDLWLFQARIQYGDHDLTLPLPLKVLWAGTTPVITLDRFPVPPLGVFSARVLFHDGQYAGTWQGGDHGGCLFGRIERPEPKEEPKDR